MILYIIFPPSSLPPSEGNLDARTCRVVPVAHAVILAADML
jgi:hypothetical protein